MHIDHDFETFSFFLSMFNQNTKSQFLDVIW